MYVSTAVQLNTPINIPENFDCFWWFFVILTVFNGFCVNFGDIWQNLDAFMAKKPVQKTVVLFQPVLFGEILTKNPKPLSFLELHIAKK